MPRRKYLYIVGYGIRLGYVLESKVALQILVVYRIRRHIAIEQKRLEFRREHYSAFVFPIIKRLYSERVASRKQRLFLSVVYHYRKHSAKLFYEPFADFFIQCYYRLYLGTRFKHVSLFHELIPDFEIIIDFSVENARVPSAFVGKRLRAFLKVNNTQPAERKRRAFVYYRLRVVGPSVPYALRHLFKVFLVLLGQRVCFKYSGKSTHLFFIPFFWNFCFYFFSVTFSQEKESNQSELKLSGFLCIIISIIAIFNIL